MEEYCGRGRNVERLHRARAPDRHNRLASFESRRRQALFLIAENDCDGPVGGPQLVDGFSLAEGRADDVIGGAELPQKAGKARRTKELETIEPALSDAV